MLIRHLFLFCIASTACSNPIPSEQPNITATDKKSFYSRSLNSVYQLYKKTKQVAASVAIIPALPIIYLAANMATAFIGTLAHESGHYAVNTIGGNHLYKVVIGSQYNDSNIFSPNSKLFSFGKYTIYNNFSSHLKNITFSNFFIPFFMTGYVQSSSSKSKLLTGTSALAGPFAGIVTQYGLQALLTGYTKYREDKNFKKAFFTGIKHGFNPYFSIVNNKTISPIQKLSSLFLAFFSSFDAITHLSNLGPGFNGSDGHRFATEVLGIEIKEKLGISLGIATLMICWCAFGVLFIKFLYHICEIIYQEELIPRKYLHPIIQFMQKLRLVSRSNLTTTPSDQKINDQIDEKPVSEQISLINDTTITE